MHGSDRLDSRYVVATRALLSSVCEGIVGVRDDGNKTHATKHSIRGVNVRHARPGVTRDLEQRRCARACAVRAAVRERLPRGEARRRIHASSGCAEKKERTAGSRRAGDPSGGKRCV